MHKGSLLVAVLGAGALFSGRTLRIEYDFDAAIALPVASAGMVVAAAGLIALHVLWLRPAAARSAEGVTAAVITAIAGVVAAVLVPIKAADWSMSDWHVHFGIVIGCALIGAVSAVVQSVTGVGSAKVPSDASMHDAIALQWQKLPERARLQLLTDRNDALDILVDRGFISESKASAHREAVRLGVESDSVNRNPASGVDWLCGDFSSLCWFGPVRSVVVVRARSRAGFRIFFKDVNDVGFRRHL